MSEVMRLDAAMVARSVVNGRDKAKALIVKGCVTVNGAVITKPSWKVAQTDTVVCSVTQPFVGRGGEKLQKVFERTDLTVDGCVCMDIGASTGGFTDCMLQHGAERVFAVDVGHDQLHASLREDDRVVCMESTDIRNHDLVLQTVALHSVDVCTVDVSFISLMAVWDSIVPFIKPRGYVICLIKPQFEAGRSALSKHGIVKQEKDHVRVLQMLCRFWQERGYGVSYLSWSPICGGEGNIEYIAVLTADESAVVLSAEQVVRGAFDALKRG